MPESGWTRRAALLHLVRAGAVLGQAPPSIPAPPPLAPRPLHPRLILPDADIPKLEAFLRDNAQARKLLSELRREAGKLLDSEVLEGREFPRMPGESRRVLDRVYLFGLLYRLEHETAYLARAVRELSAGAESREWNAAHLFETAEMTQAMAIGYDWLWPELKPEERDLFRGAIVNKGLKTALPWYQKQMGWVTTPGTANMVANAGLGIGALAVAGDEPELSAAILKYALESMARSFTVGGPDGNWIDGPGVWSFASYHGASLLAALETAGVAYDIAMLRGLERAARFRVYSTGPLGRTFVKGPGPEPTGEAPEMFWLARRLKQPALAWSEQRELLRRPRPEALDVVWYVRDPAPPQPPAWPLDALFAPQQRAMFRSSWDDDGIFLAVKGWDAKMWRAHPDLGSFVLDALGVRWALETERSAGPPAPPRAPNSPEAAIWHNTISLGSEAQDGAAEVRILGHEFTPAAAWVTLDLTRAYPSKLKLWQRRIGLLQRQAVMLEDHVRASEPVDVIWSMLTDADVSFGGQSALLSKNSVLLAAEILTPRHAVFDVVSAGPNRRRLVASLGEKTADVDLNIMLTPYKAGQPRPQITARFPSDA